MHNMNQHVCCHYGRQGHHGSPHHHGGGGGCCCGSGFTGRHFYNREEMLGHLESYLEQLRAEIKGVEEHLEQLKKEGVKS